MQNKNIVPRTTVLTNQKKSQQTNNCATVWIILVFVTNFKKELTQKEAKVLVILDLQTAHGMDAYVSPAMVMADATKKA